MHQKREMILNCRDDVINGKKIIEPIISELFNISNEFLLDLSDAANRITRHFHGSKVDIEELANIKKNFCSETSRSKFPEICTTHTYDDRVKTLKIARNAGLELCTGGIIGLGETRKQREELILEISELEPEEVTVNMLVPMPGTPLELQTQLDITEILRVFSTLRFLLPKSIIKISGGREVNLKDDGQKLLLSGANGIISAGYLTMGGNAIKKDTEMINEINLEA